MTERVAPVVKKCFAIFVIVHFALLLLDPTPFYRALTLFQYQRSCSSLKTLEPVDAKLQKLEFEVYRLARELTNLTIWKLNLDSDFPNEFSKNKIDTSEYVPNLEQKITEALSLYDADKLGVIDYALQSAGGSVISTPETNPYPSKVSFEIMGLIKFRLLSNPNLIIRPGTLPGQCFAFHGNSGRIRIRLAREIRVTSVTLEHTHKSLVSNFDTSPQGFQVYGLKNKGYGREMEFSNLGMFTYLADGPTLQKFEVIREEKSFEVVELMILNNYGNAEYTCVYRFRVHGNPV